MMVTAETIHQALQCDDPACPCHKPNGLVHCPAHADSTPSLSITEKNGKVLVKCHGGCSQDRVIASLKEKGLWPSGAGNEKGRRNKSSGRRCNNATLPGLTLEELAKAKGFQIDLPKGLIAWGVAQAKQHGATVVRIPYYSPEGQEVAVRYRKALTGDNRFSWRKGDRVYPYGLGRKPHDWTLLVEGESDCWTAWAHDLPAMGLPGASTWRPEWAEHFKGMQVYLWQEPDEAGQALPVKVGKDLPDLMVIQAPEGIKDLNEAHINGEDIPALVERLKAHAIPVASIIKAQSDKRLAELEEAAGPVLVAADDPLGLVRQAILSQGYGGDVHQPIIVYLATTSRLLAMRQGAMPVHLLLVGQASAGKSYLLGTVLRLLPAEAYHTIDAGSPRVLIYDEADLQHRVLAFGEADSLPAGEDNPAASAVRNLLQEHRLKYKVTVKNPETGEYVVKDIEKPGPTVMVSTSTRRLGYQLDTRIFSLDVLDSPDKIGEALLAQAELELNGAAAPDKALIAFQSYLQAQAPWEVVVPFIKLLATEIGRKAMAPRIMRDFARLTSLVKSVAIIRHRQRQRDKAGRIIAQVEDYAAVFDLVGPMYEATLTGASKELRATVQTVGEMLNKGESITATTLAARLNINRGTASRRVNAAIKRGWLVNKEIKKGQPWDLELGEPLPETQGLPDPEWLISHCGVAGATEGAAVGATPQHADIIQDEARCCTVASDTGDSFSPSFNMDDTLDDISDPTFQTAQRPPHRKDMNDAVLGDSGDKKQSFSESDIHQDEPLVQCGNCQNFTGSLDAPNGRGYCKLQGVGWDGKMTQFSEYEHPCSSFVPKCLIEILTARDKEMTSRVEGSFEASDLDNNSDLKEVLIR
jgi:hypothetical protein